MRTLIILTLLTIKIFGQKSCNLDKYVFLKNTKVDSNATLVYYTNDNKFYISYWKGSRDTAIKYVFEKRLLNLKGLMEITKGIIIGAPRMITGKDGKKTYYSHPQDKYLDFPTFTYVIERVKLIQTSKKTFTLEIKANSEGFTENIEIKYRAKKRLKTYTTFIDKVNNSTITCINYAGVDF